MSKYGYPFGMFNSSSLNKTKMTQPNTHSTTFNFGKVIPLKFIEVSPGDVISSRPSGLLRMSTPIAPIMTGIKGSIHAFFVPKRLVWEHMQEFYGENKLTAGPQPITYTYPHALVNGDDADSTVKVGSPAHYLGYPLRKAAIASSRNDRTLNILPVRAYYEIINAYYRKEQVMDPYLVDHGDTGAIGTRGGVAIKIGDECAPSLKNFDLFTTCTLLPVYGGDTVMPIGSYAPIVAWQDLFPTDDADEGYHAITKPGFTTSNRIASGLGATHNMVMQDPTASSGGIKFYDDNTGSTNPAFANVTNLYANLASGARAKIQDLYLAMAVEKWKYHANFGTRYFERLQVSFGVVNPDLVLQRPEHLGEYHFDINIQTVLSTAETSQGNLGQPGANSTTGFKCNLFNHSFGEPGYVIYLLNTYMDQTYSGGVSKALLKKDVLDDYWPEFVNKSDDAIDVDEVYYDETQAAGDIFGFNEAFAEERWQRSRASGLFDPYVDTSLNSAFARIPGFILSQKWNTAPSLNEAFLIEDRSALTSALVTGANGPDFLADFFFDETITRAITPRSRPGIPTDLR